MEVALDILGPLKDILKHRRKKETQEKLEMIFHCLLNAAENEKGEVKLEEPRKGCKQPTEALFRSFMKS